MEGTMRIYRIPKFVQHFFPNILWSFPDEKNAIFLTFDDGPHEIFTPQILDILDRYSAKATFFLLGESIRGNEKIIRRTHESGHAIGIHSYEHISLLRKSEREIRRQILDTKNKLESLIGEPVKFFRPPYGKFNPAMLKICQSLSLQLVLWSLMPYDFDVKINGRKLVEIFQKKVRAGDIVVLHDGHENSERMVGVLGEMIKICQDRRLELKNLDMKKS